MKTDQRETVALCLEEVAACLKSAGFGIRAPADALLERAKALRPSPSSPEGGVRAPVRDFEDVPSLHGVVLEHFAKPSPEGGTLELYVIDNWMPAGLPNYVRCKEVEVLLSVAKEIGYITGSVGHYGDHRAIKKIVEDGLAKRWNEALSALDNRRAG